MCDTNICRTSFQYQSSARSPLLEEALKIGLVCISDCSFVFTMRAVSVWRNSMSSSLLFIFFLWLFSWLCSCCEEKEYVPTWSTVNFPSYSFRCRSKFCFPFVWKLSNWSSVTCKVFAKRYPQSVCHDLERSVTFLKKYQRLIANWLCNSVFRGMRP